MKVYLISYDLSKPEQDYEGLISAIEELDSAIRIQKSVWLVDTNLDEKEIFRRLYRYIDSNDRIFICPLEFKNVIGNFTEKDIKEWFTEHCYNVV